jgi:magnesium-transporting ATPase (P-type)
MFIFHKKAKPTTILVSSFRVLSDSLTVDSLWQQPHSASNLAHVLAQAVNTSGDSLDIALSEYMRIRALSQITYKALHSFPYSHETGHSGNLWHHGADYQLAIKGTPEHILQYCDMSENERESVLMQLQAMAGRGLHCIALAAGTLEHSIKHIGDLRKNEKLHFVGLVGLKLNASSVARQCMELATSQGVNVYFASGLHPAATYYLTSQLGMVRQPSDVYDTRQLDVTNAGETVTVISTKHVFARASATQKEHIFSAIKTIDEAAMEVTKIEDFMKLLANRP